MLAVSIIALLAAIGLSHFISMRKKARYAACISHQHHTHEAAVLYAADNLVGTQIVNVDVLTAAGLLNQEVGECPASGTVDFDDYTIDYQNDQVVAITCSILGAEHLYQP